ncbi:MAG: Wzz/FepE/Etk N-terminal domain-containing protein [Solirubrobacterales bacterium]
MTDAQKNPPSMPIPPNPTDSEIDLFDYFRVIWRAKWMILFLCIVAMSATVAIVMRQPRRYQAFVTIVPPLETLQRQMVGGDFGMMGNSLLRNAIGGMGGGSMAGIYVEILESRELADSIIDRFQLMDVYEDIEYRSDARKALKKNTKIETTDDVVVKISVLDRDPNRCAAMARAYVEELDRRNKRLSGSQATSKRVFLENRLKEIGDRLSKIDNILSREAKSQETLYELLVQQYEMAKIEEARSLPTIQVIDEAVVPEVPVARSLVAKGVLAGVAAFMLGIFIAFVREYAVQAHCREGSISRKPGPATLPVAPGAAAKTG